MSQRRMSERNPCPGENKSIFEGDSQSLTLSVAANTIWAAFKFQSKRFLRTLSLFYFSFDKSDYNMVDLKMP